MSWVSRGEDRWEYVADEELHLLVRVGNEMRELHGTTVHVYLLGPAGLFPLEPLTDCAWRETSYVTAPFTDAAEAFAWLETDAG